MPSINWPIDLAYFFGGMFFINAIPHFVAGVMGKPFQSPFARPPGQGHSYATVNVIWGAINFAIAYGLIFRIGDFAVRNSEDIGALALGGVLMGLMLARHFGRFNGGNTPKDATPKQA
jgi:hypothetical protein